MMLFQESRIRNKIISNCGRCGKEKEEENAPILLGTHGISVGTTPNMYWVLY